MSKERFLVQKITVGTQEVLLEHLVSCAYIEPITMEGIKVIIELADHVGQYRDDFGLQEGAEVEVTFANPDGRGDDIWIETFIVAKPESKDGLLIVNGFGKATHDLKTPAVQPRFFNDKQPADVLKALLPHLKVDADTFERSATYHLNAGGTPARLLRSMARDFGSLCFICRGTVYFKSIKKLALTETFKLESGNPLADFSFSRYSLIGERTLFERVLNKNYLSWDTVEGLQVAKNGSNGAGVMVSVPQAKALNNQHLAIVPVLDMELSGNSKYMPAVTCSVLFHKQFPSSELDETLPEKMIITQAVHYEKGNRYQCRLEFGVKNL